MRGRLPERRIRATFTPIRGERGSEAMAAEVGAGVDAGVKAMVDAGLDSVPSQFIRPLEERANAKVADGHKMQRLPVIDLSELDGAHRAATLDQIHQACQQWGFFQVINHGVPRAAMDRGQDLAERFHRLPEQEKLAFRSGPGVRASFFSSLAFYCDQEATKDWRDVMMHTFEAGWEEAPGAWPDNPPLYKETMVEYVHGVHTLAYKLLAVMAENLGVPVDYFEQEVKLYHMLNWNFYPTCPEPDLTLGVKGHSDFGVITVLLPSEVPGLQVKKDGEWVPVEPNLDAFVVNIGDSMQAISNDLYISANHRATVNTDKDRLSMVFFMLPLPNQILSVPPQLVSPQRPARYRPYTFEEYLKVVNTCPELPDANYVLANFRQLTVD